SIGHEWEAVISDAPEQCVFCSGRRVLTGFNDLATTHPNLAQQWHPTKNNKLTPHQVTKGSGKRVWWICDKRHEWQVAIPHRVNGTGCPYCAGQRSIVGKNDLVSQHPDIAKQWHPTKN